ncbi:MAG: RNA polymerase Rpb4 family protein [Candidatus Bathyarchaeia archaeon]
MPKVVSKMEITIAEAKALLDKVENPNQFQIRAKEYASKFSKLEPEKARELVNELIKLFGIERSDAIQVVNCMPRSVEELRVFFSTGRKRLVLTEQLEKMLQILDRYR